MSSLFLELSFLWALTLESSHFGELLKNRLLNKWNLLLISVKLSNKKIWLNFQIIVLTSLSKSNWLMIFLGISLSLEIITQSWGNICHVPEQNGVFLANFIVFLAVLLFCSSALLFCLLFGWALRMQEQPAFFGPAAQANLVTRHW